MAPDHRHQPGAAPHPNRLLHSAVLENNAKVARFLLKHGADANARLRTSTDQIQQMGPAEKEEDGCGSVNVEMCELFNRYRSSSFGATTAISPNPMIAYSSKAATSYTLNYNYRSRTISESKSNTNKTAAHPKSLSIIHVAAANGNPEILELLLGFGADVNARMEGDYGPLTIAVLYRNQAIAEYLILRGADVNARSRNGKTPMYYAVKTKQLDMVLLLLRNGADPNGCTDHGVTPLHIAVERKLADVAELLLMNGAEVNARTKTGVTPLHCAAVKGQKDITEMILKYGGDVSVIMKKGEIDVTPLLWVTEGERKKISDIVYRYVRKNSAVGFYGRIFKKLWRGVIGKSGVRY